MVRPPVGSGELELGLELLDDAEVLIAAELLIEDVELLFDQTHAAEAKDALGAVLAQNEIGALGDVLRVDAVARLEDVLAAPAVGALVAALAGVAVGAEEAVLACGREHALMAAHAVVGLIGAGVVFAASGLLAKLLKSALEFASGKRDIGHVVEALHNDRSMGLVWMREYEAPEHG
jgi:hypothetical protein